MASNYEQLVKALRHCMTKEDGITICEPCPYYGKGIECENVLHTDAAAAIDELQAKVDRLTKENRELAADRPEMEEVNGHWEWKNPNDEQQLPKRGEWIHGREIGKEWRYDHWVEYYEDWHCSNCKVGFKQEEKPNYNYCPNCGAKMEVQE